jgi:hypothetical protein
MATDTKKQVLKQMRQRRYLNKDFDGLRNDLLDYARTYFPDRIQDFSEASLGGLLLDLAAYVGDVQSFYLDHQFFENFPESSIENNNIERHLRKAGVPIVGAAPSVVSVTFFIRVPSLQNGTAPDADALPIIKKGTIVRAGNSTEFELIEDVDFTKRKVDGSLQATVNVGLTNQNNVPQNFILTLDGLCISGKTTIETFTLGSFVPYRSISLQNPNVTDIVNVVDGLGNVYYEVDYLTQDTVYKGVSNVGYDSQSVSENIVPVPAPYRFIKNTSLQTRLTSLIFGGGSADSLNDDAIPDPSDFALPLYGKTTFSKFSINPGNLLRTSTLGTTAQNTTLSITYRFGGGLANNVEAGTINFITNLIMIFPNNPNSSVSAFVRNSTDVTNRYSASGGDEAPTTEELKAKIPAYTATQNRIVTKEDLIARVYTLPSNFGRVFRAAIRSNPNNPLASQLFVICRNSQNQLAYASDTLKKNLSTYLNEYRLISDAIDILDVKVININVKFSIVVDPTQNKELVLRNVLNNVKNYFSINNFDIEQPLIHNDIQNIIFNTLGVTSVVGLEIGNVYNTVNNRVYSSQVYDIKGNTYRGIVFGPPGSMFELRYPDYDITGTAV